MLGAALAGLGTGLSLIVVIGAQNAFVLRQGILRAHVPAIVFVCAASDAVLIAAGIAGVGVVVRTFPLAIELVTIIGALFLIGYGLLAARRVLRPSGMAADEGGVGSLRAAVLTSVALTWLNPHVYLDTLLLLGSVGNSYGADRWAFGVGAAIASVLWFSGLGFGARLLRRVFARPLAWRVLDVLIAAVMITLGTLLLVRL
ncbi:MAG TPA: LysE/ArgO family amino acid transporter [Pseudonocardiaceae bacterium]